MTLQQRVTDEFQRIFGEPPNAIVRAPGRVNLIGEHTDYNDGFVLPMAIDRATWIAMRPRPDRLVQVHSLDFNEEASFSVAHLEKGSGWVEYLKGVAWAMGRARFILGGWEGVMAGDVPVGAGLSSSASVELAAARAFSLVSSFPWDVAVMAKLGQKAENQWVGREYRHHGSDDFGGRQGRPCPVDRLPFAANRTRPPASGCGGGRAGYSNPPSTHRLRL